MDTQRLTIRRFRADDWEDLYEYLSDERVVRYEPYPALTQGQCREAAEHHAASEDFWAVCLRENGKLIGNVYLSEKGQTGWEIGYVFSYAYQGNGYAAEAVRALIGKIFDGQAAHRVCASCNPENTRSWQLLERVGFRREGHLRKNVSFRCSEDGSPLWQDTYIYGLLREEWPTEGR